MTGINKERYLENYMDVVYSDTAFGDHFWLSVISIGKHSGIPCGSMVEQPAITKTRLVCVIEIHAG